MEPSRHSARRALVALAFCLAACLSLTACGGGNGSSEALPRVTFSDPVAAGTVKDYTDAEWLFQNYLGDYGIPEPVKPAFMPAMKLLANGFMLQLKTGQDVRANIEQVHALFLQFVASGEAAKFFAQVHSDFEQHGAVLTVHEQPAASPEEPSDLPVISPEDQAEIAAAKLRDEQERQEIRDMAAKYGLPYRIDETPEQWFIYSPTMKGGGKGGRERQPQPQSRPVGHSSINQWGLRRGDVLWTSGTGSIPGVPGHNAITFGEGATVFIIDSNTDVGVSLQAVPQEWIDRYAEVRALTPKLRWDQGEFNCYRNYGEAFGCSPQSWRRQMAWEFADSVRGAPYNWNFLNPRDVGKFYCSSLVWNAYDRAGYNIIAPWVLGQYGLITPNMLRDSGMVSTLKVSRK